MRWLCSAAMIVLLAAGGPAARADEEFDKLMGEFRAAQQQWFKAYKEAQDKDHPEQEVDESKLAPRPEIEFTPRFQAFADKNAGKPAAVPALVWLIQSGGGKQPGKPEKSALDALATLTKTHAAQPEIKSSLGQLRYVAGTVGRKPALELFEKVAKDNPEKDAKAAAEFNIAFTYNMGDPELWPADAKKEDDAHKAQREKALESDHKLAAERFHKIAKDYADTPIGKAADSFVYEVENLQIGMTAPDIVGHDENDKEIKLSQYRGKVVVLDFWGFW